ncbi:hypothetical protein LSTR_LSTR008867 [Laodelphax striatellus]|uniref:Glycolipid transfer protein domain-containing protein n=1 Tax=Laodelphax striatellus TaxID=195883 RepID=A0A482WLI2_LAOST|nr:hypothetical protein LSTR_LSTR008867 [Laodelphax striatellus]
MSASNGGLPSEEGKNFFTTVQAPFPDLTDGKINTVQYLEACKGVVELVDRFGKVFAPVKYDMSGNIDKLSEKYASDVDKFEFLNDMVLHDKEAHEITAIDALLWLNRANHLVQRFFELILEDNASKVTRKKETRFLKAAYKETLKEHHGWIAQHLFTFLSRMCPTRKDLVNVLSLERENREDLVYRDMEAFTNKLKENVTYILKFYKEHDLENYPKP